MPVADIPLATKKDFLRDWQYNMATQTKKATAKKKTPPTMDMVDVRISRAWLKFIMWCQNESPFSDVSVQIVNGQPTKLLQRIPDVRFDKDQELDEYGSVKLI